MLSHDLRLLNRVQHCAGAGCYRLFDMLRLFASDWNEVIRQLEALNHGLNLEAFFALTDGPKSRVLEPLRKIEGLCRSLGLSLSEIYVARLIDAVERTPTFKEHMDEEMNKLTTAIEAFNRGEKHSLESTPAEFKKIDLTGQVAILRERIDDELSQVELFVVESGNSVYLADPYLFGTKVANAFQSAIRDIGEAGKCRAFERWTACVFHLMRVTEVGLRALGSSLGDSNLDPKKNPTWERILSRCDDELKKPYAERSTEWRVDQQFFSEATANLRAVKDAWRNPSLHVERDYNDHETEDVWNAVKAFMRHLATRLSG